VSEDGEDDFHALKGLLSALRARQYRFITPTPATHARVVARADKQIARDLRDIFGWSLPFARDCVQAEMFALMEDAGVLETRGEMFVSRVRVSSLDDFLFLHSAYPTVAADAVFFGPDSYRFATFLDAELPRLGRRVQLFDIGTGSGVGAVIAMKHRVAARYALGDINKSALDLAGANVADGAEAIAEEAGFRFELRQSDGLAGISGPVDVVIANPPYIADPARRAYRDGGGIHGAEISLRWAREAAERLSPGGVLLLYTGSAIVNGEDRFRAALVEALGGFDISYREIDPDVFGEELQREDYRDVERIAVVGVVAVKRAS
jgi:methylase of polypeptide subunit release factors